MALVKMAIVIIEAGSWTGSIFAYKLWWHLIWTKTGVKNSAFLNGWSQKCKDANDNDKYGKVAMTMTIKTTWKWQTGRSSPVTVLVSLDHDHNCGFFVVKLGIIWWAIRSRGRWTDLMTSLLVLVINIYGSIWPVKVKDGRVIMTKRSWRLYLRSVTMKSS